MIQTRFLTTDESELYGDWLREQSPETLADYFGIAVGEDFVNLLVGRIVNNPEEHYFLVACRDTEWLGVVHMARISEHDMEFGIMVAEQHRHQGVADELMAQAIVWIRNRGYDHLYLHCLNRNGAMKHLAIKHGLTLHLQDGDIDAHVTLPPPSLLTYTQEAITANRNIFYMTLRNTWLPFDEIHG